MYDEVKALVDVISEDTDDYPNYDYYKMVMNKLGHVKNKLFQIEESRAKNEARKKLQARREKVANEEWEKADLTSHIESDDVHIESDGWESDGTYFSRRYYISVDGNESTMHHLLVTFMDESSEVEAVNVS
jgi:hypothetical protein